MMKRQTTANIELLGTATVGPKGQVVIPVEAREKMGISPGDKVISLYVHEKNTVAFMRESDVQAMIDRMGAHLEQFRATIDNDKN